MDPLADFSDIWSNPDIAGDFQVQRRANQLGQNGRTAITNVGPPMGAFGVVAPASPNDLERLPEQQHQRKTIVVMTAFRLQGPAPAQGLAPDQQPDLVLWHGEQFVVVLVDDASNFGPGFVRVLAQSMLPIQPPPQAASRFA